MEQNLKILFSVPSLALPDKANQIKIGWEMKEKKHFFFWGGGGFWINLHKLA